MADLEYVPRNEQWRGPGRPPRRAPRELVASLLKTNQFTAARIDVTEHPAEEIHEFEKDLKAAGRELGRAVHWQLRHHFDDTFLLYYLGDPVE